MTPTLQGFDSRIGYDGANLAGLGPWVDQNIGADFAPGGRRRDAAYNRRVIEASRLVANIISGREDARMLREAMSPTHPAYVSYLRQAYPSLALGLRETMSVTDYQALFVDVLDRIYYGYYNAYPVVTMPLVRKHTLRDFRIVSRYLTDGMVSPFVASDPGAPPPQTAMYGPAPQDGAVPATAATSTAPIQYQPSLYQSMGSVNWRAIVNDDLGIFQSLPKRFQAQANNGISKFITSLFFQSSGPNTTLYQAGYRNLITQTYGASSNNPALSIEGIQDAMKILAGMLDSTGNPILMSGKMICVYGPQYTATAQNLRNMLTNWIQVEGGVGNTQGFPTQFVQTTNWAVMNMEWIMDPWIPIVASSAKGSWAIVLDPATQERPAVEVGFLAGYDTPQMYRKLPNTQRLGGGVDETMGDFYSMNQDMKIVSVFGGTQIDGRSTVASNGSGS